MLIDSPVRLYTYVITNISLNFEISMWRNRVGLAFKSAQFWDKIFANVAMQSRYESSGKMAPFVFISVS